MSTPITDARGRGYPLPRDRTTPRRQTTTGGPVPMLSRPSRTIPGADNNYLRDPMYLNDSQIRRDHSNSWPTDSRHGVGDALVDWTACGPPRPELHTRIVNFRVMAGTSATRYLPNPYDPTVGLHSRTHRSPLGNIQRYEAGSPTIRPGRQDRLTVSRRTGQSYSQTTRVQG